MNFKIRMILVLYIFSFSPLFSMQGPAETISNQCTIPYEQVCKLQTIRRAEIKYVEKNQTNTVISYTAHLWSGDKAIAEYFLEGSNQGTFHCYRPQFISSEQTYIGIPLDAHYFTTFQEIFDQNESAL